MKGRNNGRMGFVPASAVVQVHIPAEAGDEARIVTTAGTVPAIWLGTVSNGRELAIAMELMAGLERERLGQEVTE